MAEGAKGSVPLVREVRSGVEESVHEGDVAVVDAGGTLVAWAGDPHRVAFARSSMKPLQAAVSLSLAGLELPDPEVAVMCASHNGEPIHVQTVRSILATVGLDESSLRCPPSRPMDPESAAADAQKRSIYSDCSGKHSGMLAACLAQGWDLPSYRDADHPLQQAILGSVLTASRQTEVPTGVDGCGVVVHAMPLANMAGIYARLSRPEAIADLAPFVARCIEAMRAEPYLVAGRNRVDTAVMQTVDGVVVKSGAEGMICASLVEPGLGIAVKVRDGGHRAAGPALIHVLGELGALAGDQRDRLARYATPPVMGGGEPVGEVRADFALERA